MFKRLFQLTMLIGLLYISALDIAYAQTSYYYSCGFENPQDTAGWEFKTGRRIKSKFTIGKAIHCVGSKSLYVSADDGVTAGYESTPSGFLTVAYRKFTLAAGKYDVAFDVRVAGDANGNDVCRMAYFPCTAADGKVQTPAGASNGSSFPPLVQLNTFFDNRNKSDFTNTSWVMVSGTMNIPTTGDYWVAFYFKESGGLKSEVNPGACIDNIQITSKQTAPHCAMPPTNLVLNKDNGILTLTWTGTSTSYDLLYYSITSSTDTTYTYVPGLTTNTYTKPLTLIADGCYNFRVRSVCDGDTSVWTQIGNCLVYDPADHCLDYLNFTAAGVKCTSGSFDDPYKTNGAVDHGYHSKQSRHTVHYIPGETDPNTGGGLRTVRDGLLATVRLGNWETNSEAESVSYTYKLPDDANTVMLLHYAVVLEDPDHDESAQPRFKLEILDSVGRLIDPRCGVVDFKAKKDPAWHDYEGGGSSSVIRWKDWTTMGVNLQPYAGQTIKVRFTTYDCNQSGHFGYAYFALDCTDGNIDGMSCGVIPEKFTVSEGFNYRWYKISDPAQTVVCDSNVFVPAKGDTCSYYVDLISPEKNECYFTLKAYTLPRVPVPDVKLTWAPRDCNNIIDIENNSAVYTYPVGLPPRRMLDTIDSYLWELGEYGGLSQEKVPQIVVPNEGDTFDIMLRVGFNGCFGYDTITVYAPAIGESYGDTSAFICQGEGTVFNGKTYTEAGDYIDTLKTVFGCDSILELHLSVLIPDTTVTFDTICSDEVFEFFGQQLNSTGQYEHHVKSSIGCDTLVYIENLYVRESLVIALEDAPKGICADDQNFKVPYVLTEGVVTDYSVNFSDAAIAQGFVNTEVTGLNGATGIEIAIPASGDVRPDNYEATAIFYNSDCGNVEVPFTFDIYYKSDVIVQRWNDFLGISNQEFNGGYSFVAYQWYVDDSPVPGKITSHFYDYGQELEFGKEYSVALTRADDGVTQFTCPVIPTRFADETFSMMNVVFLGSKVLVEAPQQTVAEIYTMQGVMVSRQNLSEGTSEITMPNAVGIYLLRIMYADGRIHVERVVVR